VPDQQALYDGGERDTERVTAAETPGRVTAAETPGRVTAAETPNGDNSRHARRITAAETPNE
jgi:hypothetical protein